MQTQTLISTRQLFKLLAKAYPANIEQCYGISSYFNNTPLGTAIDRFRSYYKLKEPVGLIWNEYAFWVSGDFAYALQSNGTQSVLWKLNEYSKVMQEIPLTEESFTAILSTIEV